MKKKQSRFNGFPHEANSIKKYLHALSSGIFTMLIDDGAIKNYVPDDPDAFEAWLRSHNVPNIREENV